MAGIILLVMGVIFIAAGIFAGQVIGSMMGSAPDVAQEAMGMSQNLFTYIFVGVGALMSFFGVISLFRGGRRSQMNKKVLQEGIDGQGTITFVDRNYSVQINNRPIYSIVEYTYKDGMGNQYTNRVTDANTEFVIRAGWQVGAVVPIKYLSEDPQQSALLMP